MWRVFEARVQWRDSTGDELKYRLLEQYIDDAANDRIRNRTITLFNDGRRHVWIADGNKRAIAIYEASAGGAAVTVPVFIVRARLS